MDSSVERDQRCSDSDGEEDEEIVGVSKAGVIGVMGKCESVVVEAVECEQAEFGEREGQGGWVGEEGKVAAVRAEEGREKMVWVGLELEGSVEGLLGLVLIFEVDAFFARIAARSY
jgi:hypothetical protein